MSSLSSIQLDAFYSVAKNKSFSKAAQELHLTQSALSQRILNLESELNTTFFVRDPMGLRLTEAGERLLSYCTTRRALESEALEGLKSTDPERLSGTVRIAGFSTVMRSIVIPALSEIGRKHPRIQFEFNSREMSELTSMLMSGATDMILTTTPSKKTSLESIPVGCEKSVMIRSREMDRNKDTFLDHDGDDPTTVDFWKAQTTPLKKWKQSFFDEVYSTMDGVALGYGRAVVPLHLAELDPRVEIVQNYLPQEIPIYLVRPKQSVYSKLHRTVFEQLVREVPVRLS